MDKLNSEEENKLLELKVEENKLILAIERANKLEDLKSIKELSSTLKALRNVINYMETDIWLDNTDKKRTNFSR